MYLYWDQTGSLEYYSNAPLTTELQRHMMKKHALHIKVPSSGYSDILYMECGGAVVRAPGLESQGCEFDSHWVSTLATLGKLFT